jgi:hypothetical protein
MFVSMHAHEVKQNFDNHRVRLEMAQQEQQQLHLMALEQLLSSSTPCSAVAAVEVLLRTSVVRSSTNSSCCTAHELDSRQSSSVVDLLLPAQQLWCKLVAPLMLVLQHPQHDCPIVPQQAAASMLSYIACEPSEQQAVVLQQLQDHVQWQMQCFVGRMKRGRVHAVTTADSVTVGGLTGAVGRLVSDGQRRQQQRLQLR